MTSPPKHRQGELLAEGSDVDVMDYTENQMPFAASFRRMMVHIYLRPSATGCGF